MMADDKELILRVFVRVQEAHTGEGITDIPGAFAAYFPEVDAEAGAWIIRRLAATTKHLVDEGEDFEAAVPTALMAAFQIGFYLHQAKVEEMRAGRAR